MRNINKDELTICLMVEELSSDFSIELVQSVTHSLPRNKKIRLIVVPGKYDDGRSNSSLHNYRTVYNSVFRLGEFCRIDGFIIHLGSIRKEDCNYSQIYQYFVNKWQDVPKVLVASDLTEETTVNYDNETGIRTAVDYLVNAYGCTKMCMLGGREDNKDACARREIFSKCLAEYKIEFGENEFEYTDMSENCITEAEYLLDRNPDVQAVFCVNDSVAKALYEVMRRRKLRPGTDIMVFGFDNTKLSGEMNPSLTSIGPDSISLGQKALELLLEKLSGKTTVEHATIPTRLYGRQSFPFEPYDYNTIEMMKVEPSFIYKMFRDCFYRYDKNRRNKDSIDLERLFFEIMTQVLIAMNNRYLSPETSEKLVVMIDKFFEKGAMDYTDAAKFIESLERVQQGINQLSHRSMAVRLQLNRLFSRMKDRAIISQAEKIVNMGIDNHQHNERIADFLISGVGNGVGIESILRNFDKLGIRNCSLFVFDEPVDYQLDKEAVFPDIIKIRCMMRSGELYILSEERQKCRMYDIFARSTFNSKHLCHTAFPIFCGNTLYGLLMTELTDDIFERGELIALHLGRSFALCSG